MLTVKELRSIAKKLSAEDFCWQLGPFVIVQRPEAADSSALDDLGKAKRPARTVAVLPEQMKEGGVEVIRDFEDLSVATLPPLGDKAELVVGRQADCDLVVDHPSVSKRHAVFRWDAAKEVCSIKDLGSTNGTLIDSEVRVKGELPLSDGEVVTVGEVHFWFLRTPSLHARLTAAQKKK